MVHTTTHGVIHHILIFTIELLLAQPLNSWCNCYSVPQERHLQTVPNSLVDSQIVQGLFCSSVKFLLSLLLAHYKLIPEHFHSWQCMPGLLKSIYSAWLHLSLLGNQVGLSCLGLHVSNFPGATKEMHDQSNLRKK